MRVASVVVGAALVFASVCVTTPVAWAATPGGMARVPSCALVRQPSRAYLQKIAKATRELGVPPGYARRHHLVVEPEAKTLVPVEKDIYGYPTYLVPSAAAALLAMQAQAARDHVTLQTISGYRSFSYQVGLVRRHLQEGLTIRQALRINDLPGYSEHQTGCAVDLTTPGVGAATVDFAKTPAYRWLQQHAAQFGFRLTYGPHNDHQVEFEPWHWRFTPYEKASKSGGR